MTERLYKHPNAPDTTQIGTVLFTSAKVKDGKLRVSYAPSGSGYGQL